MDNNSVTYWLDEPIFNPAIAYFIKPRTKENYDTEKFIRKMFIADGVPSEVINAIKPDDELFVWIKTVIERCLDHGAAYGECWATIQDRLVEHFQKNTQD